MVQLSWLEDASPSYPILFAVLKDMEMVYVSDLTCFLSHFLDREREREKRFLLPHLNDKFFFEMLSVGCSSKIFPKSALSTKTTRSSFGLWMDQGFKTTRKQGDQHPIANSRKTKFCKICKRTDSIMIAHSFDPLVVFSSPFIFGAFSTLKKIQFIWFRNKARSEPCSLRYCFVAAVFLPGHQRAMSHSNASKGLDRGKMADI